MNTRVYHLVKPVSDGFDIIMVEETTHMICRGLNVRYPEYTNKEVTIRSSVSLDYVNMFINGKN